MNAYPHAVSSPGSYLTAASPTPSFPLCRELRASAICRLSGFWALLAFPGISVTSCFKLRPPSPTPAIPFSLEAQEADSHHPSPCPSAWLLLSNRKLILHVEMCNVWERHGQFATEGHGEPPYAQLSEEQRVFFSKAGMHWELVWLLALGKWPQMKATWQALT